MIRWIVRILISKSTKMEDMKSRQQAGIIGDQRTGLSSRQFLDPLALAEGPRVLGAALHNSLAGQNCGQSSTSDTTDSQTDRRPHFVYAG